MTPSPFFKDAYLYKDVHAVPGSRLHELLSANKLKEAEQHYKEVNEKAKKLEQGHV